MKFFFFAATWNLKNRNIARSAAQHTKWCIQSAQSLCGRKRAADKIFLICSEPFQCFRKRAPEKLFLEPLLQIVKQRAVADIYSSALQCSHVLAPSVADSAGNDGLLFSAAMIGGLAPQPLPVSASRRPSTGNAVTLHGSLPACLAAQ